MNKDDNSLVELIYKLKKRFKLDKRFVDYILQQGKDYNGMCEKIKEYLDKDEENFKEELCDFMIRGMFTEEY
jgi:antitoxin component HigA of HigAB toxin-antitoxin module